MNESRHQGVTGDLAGYFDCAASAPPFEEALAAQARVAAHWFGNPSASHGPGVAAQAEWRRLKQELGELCHFTDGRIVVTAGATEANNGIVHGVMAQYPRGRILVAADVHLSIWGSAMRYPDRMDVLPVESDGRIALGRLADALRPETRLFCCSHGANETGVIHDVAAMAALCERKRVMTLVDGVQALGHVPVCLAEIPCEFYVFSAHKFGGPRGCGGAFFRSGEMIPPMQGGPQEWGLRPGTENLPGLAGAVAALRASLALIPVQVPQLRRWSRGVVDRLRASGLTFVLNGDPRSGLPGLISVSFPGCTGQVLVTDLALKGFAVATGSACAADRQEPSRVILAMGRSAEQALGTVRIAMGRHTTEGDVVALTHALIEAVRRNGGRSAT